MLTRVEFVGGGPLDGEVRDLPIEVETIYIPGEITRTVTDYSWTETVICAGVYVRRQFGNNAGFEFVWSTEGPA